MLATDIISTVPVKFVSLYFIFCITDAGFMVGGDTGINYLVLQIHYKDVSNFLPPSKYIFFYNFFKNKYWFGTT